MPEVQDDVISFLAGRRSVPVSQIGEPAPGAAELAEILKIAARVPDYGRLEPWRFIVYRGEARHRVGEFLAMRLDARDGPLDEETRKRELNRFARAPLVVGVISSPKPHERIPEWEQFLSGGAVAMMLSLAANAHGYVCNWITNWYSGDAEARRLLGMAPHERVIGFVHIGSFEGELPAARPRPDISSIVTDYDGPYSAGEATA